MQLVTCPRPLGALESAPATSLAERTVDGRWEGFWAEDESYVARCTGADGGVLWYRIVDDAASGAEAPQDAPRPDAGTILSFPPIRRNGTFLLMGRGTHGARIMVGSAGGRAR